MFLEVIVQLKRYDVDIKLLIANLDKTALFKHLMVIFNRY